MSFSELSLARREAGLSYDADTLTLYGEKRGYGLTVTDENGEYILRIYAAEPYKYEKNISEAINSLAEGLPKNALNAQRCEFDFVELRLCRSFFLQENLPELFNIAESLISVLCALCVTGAPARLPEKSAKDASSQGGRKHFVPDFDVNSVKGLFGALIGAAAMVFIASAVIQVRTDEVFAALFAQAGIYVIHAVSTALVFFDYRFLAKKLDAFGVFVCTISSVMCAAVSALLVSAKAYSSAAEISVSAALADLGGFYETSPDAAAFCAKYLTVGLIMSAISSVIFSVWYFRKHPDEMITAEKAEKRRNSSSR